MLNAFILMGLICQGFGGYCLTSAIDLDDLQQSEMIPFYRHPSSAFASGQARLSELIKNQKNLSFFDEYQVLWNMKEYSVKASDLLRDQNLLTRVLVIKNPLQPRIITTNKLTLDSEQKNDINYPVIDSSDYWLNIQIAGKKVKVEYENITPIPTDLGQFINIVDTYLRNGPNYEQAILTTIPKSNKFIPLSVESGWLKIKFGGKIGFVDINHCVGRADFAEEIYTNQWIKIKYRSGEYVVTKDDKKIRIADIKGYVANPEKAIFTAEKPNQPFLNSDVLIINHVAKTWVQSELADHGTVYWVQDDSLLNKKKLLTTDEIIKGEIISYSVDKKNQNKALVSKNGIFKTSDGINWENIHFFKDKNYPVLINQGLWFVGPFLSNNQGRSFTNYLRWDVVADLIQNHLKHIPNKIEIKSIKVTTGNKLQLEISTGQNTLKMIGYPNSTNWKIL